MNESLDDFFVTVGSDDKFAVTVGALMFVVDPGDIRRGELEREFEAAYLAEVRAQNRGVLTAEMTELINRARREIDRFLPRAVNALRQFYRERVDDQHLMPPPPQDQNALDQMSVEQSGAERQDSTVSSGSDQFDLSDGYGTDFAIGSHGDMSFLFEDLPSERTRMLELTPEARKKLMRNRTPQKPTPQSQSTGASKMTLRSAKRGLKEETDSDAELAPKRTRLATKPTPMVLRSGPKLKRKMDSNSDSTDTSPEERKKAVKKVRQELEYDLVQSDEEVSEEAIRRLSEKITDPKGQARRFMILFKKKRSLLPRQASSSSSDGQGGRYPENSNRAGFPSKRTSRLPRIDIASVDKKEMYYVKKFEGRREVQEFAAVDDYNQPSTSGPYRIPVSDDDEPGTRRQANKPSTSGQTHPEDGDEEMESDH